MIEREIFIIKEEDSVCLGQKFSKPTQMFSVSVFEIFLDTKNKFYISFFWSTNFVLLLLFLGTRGIEEKKKQVQTPLTKDKLNFLSLSVFSFSLNITRFFFICMSIFMSDFFQCFRHFHFLFLGFFPFNK